MHTLLVQTYTEHLNTFKYIGRYFHGNVYPCKHTCHQFCLQLSEFSHQMTCALAVFSYVVHALLLVNRHSYYTVYADCGPYSKRDSSQQTLS